MFKDNLQWLKTLLAKVSGLIYPDVCQICENEKATSQESYVCRSCRCKIKYIEPPFCEQCGKPYEGDI
ncbi:MAG: double zinc ribbon domain-containing protein, partial [Limisphaerales bacterium]